MKLTTIVTLLPVLLSSFVGYATARRDILRVRQAHMKRSISDICIPVPSEGFKVPCDGGEFTVKPDNGCFCNSTMSDFVANNNEVKDKQDEFFKLITPLFNDAATAKPCEIPNHAVSACTTGDFCAFKCQDGYSSSDPSARKCSKDPSSDSSPNSKDSSPNSKDSSQNSKDSSQNSKDSSQNSKDSSQNSKDSSSQKQGGNPAKRAL